jgi:DNA repair exonuclease SbcCD ATPase subunit
MDPIRLQLENFVMHSKSDIAFDEFSSALIIGKIKGSEKFSNGAGKSTIFNAIKYALFNKVDFSALDKVIRKGTEYCKVIFDFRSMIDNEIYRIQRSRNKKAEPEVRLFKKTNGEWFDITSRRNSDTEKDIEKLIKINYNTFCHSVLFSQSDLSGIAALTPKNRKSVLKETLQLGIYSKYEAMAKHLAKELIKEIDKEKTILSTYGNPANDIVKLEEELNIINNIITEKNEFILLTKDILNKESETLIELSKNFEAFERQAQESATKQKLLQDEIQKLSNVVQDYNKKISLLKQDGKLISNEIKDISSQIEKAFAIQHREKDIIKNEIEEYAKNIINTKSRFNFLTSKIADLKIPLPTGSICKHCRKPTDPAARELCQKEIDAELIIRENELNDTTLIINEIIAADKKLKTELKNVEEIEELIHNKKSILSAKQKEIDIKKSIYNEYSELLDKTNEQLMIKNIELNSIKKEQLIDNINEYNTLKTNINNSNRNIQIISRELEEAEKYILSLHNNYAVLLHKISQKKNDIDKIKECSDKILEIENKYIVHQKVIQAFGSKGIPALITHTILDDFQIESNILLSRFRPGLQLQFSIIKDRDDGDKEDTLDLNYILDGFDVEYEQLSGAQKFLVALSLKLGLASVIKKRLGVQINMLLIDEVDQSLDEGSLEAFEEAIRELQKQFKILIITHNKELKSKFNYAILVEQHEKFSSTAKVVNEW